MEERKARIYLDNCCYNRPYDVQDEPRVYFETQAKILIQDMIRHGKVELVSSTVLDYEISKSPFRTRKKVISNFIDNYSIEKIKFENSPELLTLAHDIMASGVKEYDAFHVAVAILSKCDYFISTDKRLLKYHDNRIKIINPIDFIEGKGE